MSSVSGVRVIGGRDEQEDRYCMQPFRTNTLEGHMLAVFDGHGGASTAQRCRTLLPHYFAPRNAEDVPTALTKAIAQLAKEVCSSESGTTVSVACILESHDMAVIAVLGDSPVVVRKTDGSLWMSSPHNVGNNASELKTAMARGAHYSQGYISVTRHGPGLQLSRALGDASLRKILSDTPEVSIVESPSAVLLATDGVFNDEYTDEETLRKFGKLIANDIDANDILNWRMREGGRLNDNVTVLLWRR